MRPIPQLVHSLISSLAMALTLAVAATGSLIAQDVTTVYRGARLLPGGKAPIEHGVLVIAGGKIQAIGDAALAIPDGATVVDCEGKTITPGLIDAAFQTGANLNDLNEQSEEVTPSLRVLDTLDPEDPVLVRARNAGVTAAHIMPGTRNVIGGLGCVVKTFGTDPSAMLLKADASLRIVMGAEPSMGNRAIRGGEVDSIYYRRPTTRMGVIWAVRDSFYKAKAALQQTQGAPPAAPNPGLEVLKQVLQGKLTAVTTARSEQDLRTALRIANEFGYKTIIDEAQDAYLVADELAAAKVSVMLGAPSAASVGGTGSADGADPRFATVRVLADKGVHFVITTGTNQQALDLVREAMFAVRNGLSPMQALDAVTIEPAHLLGLDNRIGSLARGKDADLVIWSRDPLDPAAVAESVLVDGHNVSQAPR